MLLGATESKKDLELKLLKLYNKALKQFPNSIKQNETKKEIEKIRAKINKLK